MLSTKLFNIRLYLEGLKRLKVIGMAVAILSVTISALIPLVRWMDLPGAHVETIKQQALCVPLYGVIFLAPFFFSVLFSFLHKRRESDFFHAIPYTRTCVYLSFVASALTFVFAIMIASAATAGILWALNPFTTFNVGELISLTLMCMLAAAELSAMMMLALSLTGTGTTTFLMFALFSLLTRLVMFYMATCVDSNIVVISLSEVPFFNFSWFLPFGVFNYAISGAQYNPADSLANIIYSVVVTLLVFAAAWFFYKIRKSEMAGNTAPNRVTQHIFRILFTLPFMLLIPMFMITDSVDFPGFFVMIVITLLVYYLYELITTKRFNCFGRATALLPVLVGCSLLFAGIYSCVETAIFRSSPDDPEKVTAINIDASYALGWDNYQKYLMQDSTSEDRELIEKVVDNMILTVKGDRTDNFQHHFGSGSRTVLNVTFTMNNGKTISRRVAFRNNEIENIRRQYINTVHIDPEVFWSLPHMKHITQIYGELYSNGDYGFIDVYHFSEREINDFYKTLLEEYNALSIEEKDFIRTLNPADEYKYQENAKNDAYFAITISGRLPDNESLSGGYGRYFSVSLAITEDMMPETFRVLQNLSKTYLE